MSLGFGFFLFLLPPGLNDARAHDEGPEDFPCSEGPFGLPGLQGPPDQIGEWGPVQPWPDQATHMTVLHTGKVLWFRGDTPPWTSYLWDPVTDVLEERLTANNTFCAGHATLADGRAIVIGGTVDEPLGGLSDTILFDPISETWSNAASMAFSRWYPTATLLPDGRVLSVSGVQVFEPYEKANIPEIYDPDTDAWTQLPGAELNLTLYPFNFVLPSGKIVSAGPATQFTRTLDLDSQLWQTVATSNFVSTGGSAVMYAPGKILKTGGVSSDVVSTEVLDMTVQPLVWRVLDADDFPRRELDLVILPDGTVLSVGGSVDGRSSPECAIHAPAIWDPDTELWTTMASHSASRVYHSTAVLLPDGRVLTAGGENRHIDGEDNYEIYSPPYLFQGPRPTVAFVPDSVDYMETFQVSTLDAGTIDSVAFVRPSSVTHKFDQNQRYVSLSFQDKGTYLEVTAPANANLAPPGYYMMFLVNGSGSPSHAEFVRLGPPLIPACSDGLDNDSDGFTDYPAEDGCNGPTDPSEYPDCDDGLDNDLDGLSDYPADNGCRNRLPRSKENPQCNDGTDNDGDGFVDGADPECAASAAWWDDESRKRNNQCGLGFELALALPPLMWLDRRRRRDALEDRA
jgi:hypothetical protein